ncbi:jg17139 [Pararge aegeria aegeria]|uniref:Jg17139 protein n=1 Tax=Pararge aegeria aegeria TaxID=348720 RepID=A0A8S4RN36_9NEOP|nr:jg17139 [Pararge aegeria aegeria]
MESREDRTQFAAGNGRGCDVSLRKEVGRVCRRRRVTRDSVNEGRGEGAGPREGRRPLAGDSAQRGARRTPTEGVAESIRRRRVPAPAVPARARIARELCLSPRNFIFRTMVKQLIDTLHY